MSVDSLGLTLGKGDSITFWASRTDESACLVIKVDGTHCEIGMDRENVEALRDQLPDVLAGLDRWAAEEEACEKAGIVEKRAVDATAQALDVAVAAEQAGAHELAASLREAAAEASTTADAVDATVRAFESATAEVDHAASKLVYLTSQVSVELDRLRGGDDRPAESVRVGTRTVAVRNRKIDYDECLTRATSEPGLAAPRSGVAKPGLGRRCDVAVNGMGRAAQRPDPSRFLSSPRSSNNGTRLSPARPRDSSGRCGRRGGRRGCRRRRCRRGPGRCGRGRGRGTETE